jgi:hypothetical protein
VKNKIPCQRSGDWEIDQYRKNHEALALPVGNPNSSPINAEQEYPTATDMVIEVDELCFKQI